MAEEDNKTDPKDPKPDSPEATPVTGETPQHPVGDDPYAYGEDPYSYEHTPAAEMQSASAPAAAPPNPVVIPEAPKKPAAVPSSKPPTPPPPPDKGGGSGGDDGEEEEEGMVRMSFLEHLEELRTRLIRALLGFGAAFVACLFFAPEIWKIVSEPALAALKHLGANPPTLVATAPMEQFNTIWIKAPAIVSIFVGSPLVLYQVWAFIAPGLYKRERRWAIPFIVSTSGLFILGGLFAYFIVFRYGLEFLLGIGREVGVQPFITISEYFDLFVNIMLGVGIVFELPILIFFLTLLRIVSPRFLIEHSRYAILAIVIVAAVVTPTPDVFNLMLFAVPMILLYFVGVFAAYLLVLKREGRKFPWGIAALILLGLLALGAGGVWLAVAKYGFKLLNHWPYLSK